MKQNGSAKPMLQGYNICQFKSIQKNLKYLDIILSNSIEKISIEKMQEIILCLNQIEDIVIKIELLIEFLNEKSG